MRDMGHNNQKKVAAVNDLSGFGRCSTTVLLPIISYMGVQCCPVITSVFSNHSGYDSYFFDDYTDKMQPYIDEWKKLGLEFEGIYTGFLGSHRQIDIVRRFIDDFRTERTTVIVDPVMGDGGNAYSTYTEDMCKDMRRLVSKADIVTPNVTEACMLTGTEYREKYTDAQLRELAGMIAQLGPKKIVITGIRQGSSYISNYIYEENADGSVNARRLRSKLVGTTRCGTGDIFASIICADAVNGVPLEKSVRKASAFIKECILKSMEYDIPETDGVCFEEVLYRLKR